jgi:hypothetical protein
MTQPPWTPDFSRAPQSAHEMWQRVVSSKSVAAVLALNLDPQQDAQLAAQLGGQPGHQGKSAAILAAADLTDQEDEIIAGLLDPVIKMIASVTRRTGS